MSDAATVTTAYDDLDLSVVMAVVADGVGCEDDSHMVECTEMVGACGEAVPGRIYYTFSPAAVDALLAASAEGADQVGWLDIAAAPLAQDLVRELGEEWYPEVELAADRALAERSGRLERLARVAAAGPVGFDTATEAARLVAPGCLTAELALLI